MSMIECYMKEYEVSKQEAYIEFQKEITNRWKDTNKELLHPIEVHMFVLERVLNFTRAMDILYKRKTNTQTPKVN